MDKIHIKDILLRCIIGIYEDERKDKQDVLINITLHTDTSKAGKTDDFQYALDYKAVKKKVIALVESSEYFLVEALAENIADKCLEFDSVQQVDVTVEKPGALRFARSVGVEISRKKV